MIRTTSLLSDFGLTPDLSMIPFDKLEHARLRGKAVHRAIELYEQGRLDIPTLHEEVKPRVDAYLEWAAREGWRSLGQEEYLEDPITGLTGHLDQYGTTNETPDGTIRILDMKAVDSIEDSVKFQLAAYGHLLRVNRPDIVQSEWGALLLKPNGKAKYKPFSRQDIEAAWQTVACCLHVRRERAVFGR